MSICLCIWRKSLFIRGSFQKELMNSISQLVKSGHHFMPFPFRALCAPLFPSPFTLYFLTGDTKDRKIPSAAELKTTTPYSGGGLDIALHYSSDVCLIHKCHLSQNNLRGLSATWGQAMLVLPMLLDTWQERPPCTHTACQMTGLQVPQHNAVQRLKQNWESGHHNLGLVRDLMAQKAGRQELTEAVWITLASFVWPPAHRLLLKILCWSFPFVVPCRSRFSKPLIPVANLAVLSHSHLRLFPFLSFFFYYVIKTVPQNMDTTLPLMPHKYSVDHSNYCSQAIPSNISSQSRVLLCSSMTILTTAQSATPSDSYIFPCATADKTVRTLMWHVNTLNYSSYINSSSSYRKPTIKLGWNLKRSRFQVWLVTRAVSQQHSAVLQSTPQAWTLAVPGCGTDRDPDTSFSNPSSKGQGGTDHRNRPAVLQEAGCPMGPCVRHYSQATH